MMDLIDRQAVIDALVSETCYVDEEEIRDVVNDSALKQREWIGGILDAIQAVKEVAQANESGVKCFNGREYIVRFTGDALQLMPDVMQELVRCKDCKKSIEPCGAWDRRCKLIGVVTDDFHCGWGEKKESDD